MPANKIKLEICGASYVIATTDTEEYILSLAEKLDADMNQMMTNNPSGVYCHCRRYHGAGLFGRAEEKHQRRGQHARADQRLP